MSDKTAVLVFRNGLFIGVSWRRDFASASSYSDGLEIGSRRNGVSECIGYVMPCNDRDMRDVEEASEVAKALDAMAKEHAP